MEISDIPIQKRVVDIQKGRRFVNIRTDGVSVSFVFRHVVKKPPAPPPPSVEDEDDHDNDSPPLPPVDVNGITRLTAIDPGRCRPYVAASRSIVDATEDDGQLSDEHDDVTIVHNDEWQTRRGTRRIQLAHKW